MTSTEIPVVSRSPSDQESSGPVGPEPNRLVGRISSILAAHTSVDIYTAIVPAILGVLEIRCGLTARQTALTLGIASLASGLSQPVCAWLSDRYDSRLFGGLGVLLASVCLCLVGAAYNLASLWALLILGTVGAGMFHPIAASSLGQLSHRRRSLAMSGFFVAGMLGGMCGAFVAPRLIAQPNGFYWLASCMVPGLLFAYALQRSIAAVPHRVVGHDDLRFETRESAARWANLGLLYLAAATRFSVNMALVYLFVRWVQADVGAANPSFTQEETAKVAAPIVGNLNAFMVAGMALGGLMAGFLIRPGREKWPMVWVPILFAPAIWYLPHTPIAAASLLSSLAGIGFSSMVPIGIAVGQRLLPHRTSLASGLMLGGAWAVAFVGPLLAQQGIMRWGIEATFARAAVALALSGLIILPTRFKTELPT